VIPVGNFPYGIAVSRVTDTIYLVEHQFWRRLGDRRCDQYRRRHGRGGATHRPARMIQPTPSPPKKQAVLVTVLVNNGVTNAVTATVGLGTYLTGVAPLIRDEQGIRKWGQKLSTVSVIDGVNNRVTIG